MTNWASDEELMLQVRNGAGEVLGDLFNRYQTPLFNYYLRLTGNRMLSEDLVQEVFLRILKYRRTYNGNAFRAWIYRIARNARMDHLRGQHPQTEWTPEMSPAVHPGDPAQQQQEAALLNRALMQLPEEKREVLILSRLQELKHEEIAGLLGCEVGTVKVRVHRALQELKQVFHQLQSSGAPGPGRAGEIPPRGVSQ